MSGPTETSHGTALAQALTPYLSAGDGRGGVLLAVSGGPDSTALMHAAASLPPACPVAVATVDHRLRPGSAAEAEAVAELATHLGLPHRVLVWDASAPGSRVQATARAARYGLLAAHADAISARFVLTAHTADDQAETVLMRLTAGSGPAGLAGMARQRALGPGIVLARPFLGLSKTALVAYCRAHSLPFVSDPSNADPRYARARLRTLTPMLAAEGLTTTRLLRLAERQRRDGEALARAAEELRDRITLDRAVDHWLLDGAGLCAAPSALAIRILDSVIGALAPRSSPARLEPLERLVLGSLLPALAEGRGLRRTLRGVLVAVGRDGTVRLSPAPPRRQPCRDSLVAGGSDLLGKGEAPAYIGGERVASARVCGTWLGRLPGSVDEPELS